MSGNVSRKLQCVKWSKMIEELVSKLPIQSTQKKLKDNSTLPYFFKPLAPTNQPTTPTNPTCNQVTTTGIIIGTFYPHTCPTRQYCLLVYEHLSPLSNPPLYCTFTVTFTTGRSSSIIIHGCLGSTVLYCTVVSPHHFTRPKTLHIHIYRLVNVRVVSIG